MALNEEQYQRLERYLEGAMDPPERQQFEDELAGNEALAKELALYQDMKEMLADTPENELRKNLALLGDRQHRPGSLFRRLLWILVPFSLLAGWWYLGREADSASEPDQVIIQGDTILEQPSDAQNTPPPSTDTLERPGTQTTPAQELPPPPSSPETPPPQKKQQNEPIAAADFTPNPSLEFLIDNNLRADDIVWSNIQLQPDVKLAGNQASFTFQFSSTLTTTEPFEAQTMLLHLFSNQAEDFDNFEPLQSFELRLDKTDEQQYEIQFEQPLQLSPGLYYYLIENAATEQIYKVARFELRQ
jgi:hypothetical protein